MKIVKKIFIDDVVSLSKNFFALVIAIGICFLPALYAWFNIYSNWDPYGNTGALKMAVYSEDKGYTTDDGEYKNQGDSIIENLHENTSVDWQFVDSADAAIKGVHEGEYYAAVVIDENFTYSMYNIFSDEVEEPTLIFYQNQKKNPVANKISDTVVSTLQNNINEAFVEVVISEVFSGASDLYDELKKDGGAEGLLDNLKSLNSQLDKYESTISSVIATDKALIKNLELAKDDAKYLQNQSAVSANAVQKANGSVAQTQVTIGTYTDHLNASLGVISDRISHMQETITKSYDLAGDYKAMNDSMTSVLNDLAIIRTNKTAIAGATGDDAWEAAEKTAAEAAWVKEKATNPTKYAGKSEAELSALEEAFKNDYYNNYLKEHPKPSSTTQQADQIIAILEEMAMKISGNIANETVEQADKVLKSTLSSMYDYTIKLQETVNNELVPNMNKSIDSLEVVLDNTTAMLNSMSDTFGTTISMFSALSATLESADISLDKTNQALEYVNSKLSIAIEKAEAVNTKEQMQILVDTLAGSPEAYGEFFSEPVEIITEPVYPIENYGSAVAPFYTTLAIWVGSLILTAIIKVHPDKKKYKDATKTQMYFGRLILYLILGQLQAAVIVLGDLKLVGIQCVEPGWFFLAASITSITFTVLIYSLVVTWGDVGKALAVVIVVLQIAGSSGTYPIELLPEFFRKVYIFFPFPYAINAMRECTCGMYGSDFSIYLLELSIFIIVSLVIGLIIRIPFEEINHYMEERMEETEMM